MKNPSKPKYKEESAEEFEDRFETMLNIKNELANEENFVGYQS